MKKSLQDFGKLHKGLVGVDDGLQDGFYNQASLSIRVLLSHFVRCVNQATWDVAKRNYKGKEKLEPVEDVIGKVVLKKKKKADVTSEHGGGASKSWQELQSEAPDLPLWKVHFAPNNPNRNNCSHFDNHSKVNLSGYVGEISPFFPSFSVCFLVILQHVMCLF